MKKQYLRRHYLYDSQEEVSEEGNQEIAETETKTLLTFEELHTRRL